MISHCPHCEAALRNPKRCACGWTLEELVRPKQTTSDIFQDNKQKAKELLAFVNQLNLPYEPGSDFGLEYE